MAAVSFWTIDGHENQKLISTILPVVESLILFIHHKMKCQNALERYGIVDVILHVTFGDKIGWSEHFRGDIAVYREFVKFREKKCTIGPFRLLRAMCHRPLIFHHIAHISPMNSKHGLWIIDMRYMCPRNVYWQELISALSPFGQWSVLTTFLVMST